MTLCQGYAARAKPTFSVSLSFLITLVEATTLLHVLGIEFNVESMSPPFIFTSIAKVLSSANICLRISSGCVLIATAAYLAYKRERLLSAPWRYIYHKVLTIYISLSARWMA